MAWLVLAVLMILAWHLSRKKTLVPQGRWLIALCALQLCTGLSNVVLGWPLLSAVMHTGGAAALVMVLTWALAASQWAVSRPVTGKPPSPRYQRFVP